MKLSKIILSTTFLLVIVLSAQGQLVNEIGTGRKEMINAMSFPEASTGYAVGMNGTLLRTTNGGESWQDISRLNRAHFSDIQFLDKSTGYLLTENGQVLKTSNGAESWSYTTDKNNTPISSSSAPSRPKHDPSLGRNSLAHKTIRATGIYFLTTTKGFMIATISVPLKEPKGVILRTLDGGIKWDTLFQSTTLFSAIHFPDQTNGFVVGEQGKVLKTTNGGNTWQSMTAVKNQDLRDVFFVDALTGYAVGGNGKGVIIKTIDGGQSWIEQKSSTIHFLHAVHFKTATRGYAAGGGGTILKTSNGGQTWQVVATNPRGEVLKSTCMTSISKAVIMGREKSFTITE